MKTLIDSGCTDTCVSKDLVQKENLPTEKLERPRQVFNADGTPNVDGNITECVKVEVEMGGHKEDIKAAVVQLENRTDMIIGHDWLIKHNPEINWNTGTIHFT